MAINLKKLSSLVRLIRHAFRQHGRSFILITLLGFIGGLFEGIGIASVIPLFYVATGKSAESISTITSFILKALALFHIPLTVAPLLSLIVALFICKGIVQFVVRYYNAIVIARFEEDYRKVTFRRTFKANWQYLLKQKSGYLESILLYDTERGTVILGTLSNIIITGTTFLAYAIIALSISSLITLVTMALGAIIFYALKPAFYRIRHLMTDTTLAQKDLAHHVAEHQASLKSIKAMAIENPVIAYANTLFARVRSARIKASRIRQSTLAFIEPVGFILIAILFILNYRQPGFDIASFAVIMFLIQRMFSYVQFTSTQIQAINEMSPYLRTMMRLRRDAKKHEEVDSGAKKFALQNELRLENISFAYRNDQPILNSLNLTIPQGQIIGIVGQSGAGKTTLVDLLLHLFELTGGRITVDGVDIKEVSLVSWRKHCGYVPQDGVLLDTSIRENIRFYSPNITEEGILQAARQANIYDTILNLPEGLDTLAGGHGVNLSGGQRQRILLARALARKPQILILDEATSALDTESEKLIQNAIQELRGKMTVIIIAHRLSTIMGADQVVVLDNGQVAESGSPQELLANSRSHFARLYTAGEHLFDK